MEEFEILKCQDLVDEDFAGNEMDDLFGDGYEGVGDLCHDTLAKIFWEVANVEGILRGQEEAPKASDS